MRLQNVEPYVLVPSGGLVAKRKAGDEKSTHVGACPRLNSAMVVDGINPPAHDEPPAPALAGPHLPR